MYDGRGLFKPALIQWFDTKKAVPSSCSILPGNPRTFFVYIHMAIRSPRLHDGALVTLHLQQYPAGEIIPS